MGLSLFLTLIYGAYKMIINKVKATDSIAEKIMKLPQFLIQKVKDIFKMIDSKLEKIEKELEESDHIEIDPNFYYYF